MRTGGQRGRGLRWQLVAVGKGATSLYAPHVFCVRGRLRIRVVEHGDEDADEDYHHHYRVHDIREIEQQRPRVRIPHAPHWLFAERDSE